MRNSPAIEHRPRTSIAAAAARPSQPEVHPQAPSPPAPTSIREKGIGGSSLIIVVGAACRCRCTTSTDTERERTTEPPDRCAQQPGDQHRPRSSRRRRGRSPQPARGPSSSSIAAGADINSRKRNRAAAPSLLLSAPRAAAAAPRQRIRRERGRLRPPTAVRNSPTIELDPVAQRAAVAARPSSPRSILKLHRRRRRHQFAKKESGGSSPHYCCRRRVPLPLHHANGYGERGRLRPPTAVRNSPTIESRPRSSTRRRGRSPHQPEVHPQAPSPPAPTAIREKGIGGSSLIIVVGGRVPLPLHHGNGYGEREDD